MKPHLYAISLMLVALTLPFTLYAQDPAPVPKPAEKPSPAPQPAMPSPPRGPAVPLKLNVVISKYQNDKKLSSLPYSLSLNSNGNIIRLRMGAQVPYATSTVSEGKPVPGYSYRDVGVSIDASVGVSEPGVYRIDLTVEDTSISTSSQVQGAPSITGVPIFKTFRTSNAVMLRDGQTTQLTTAADPISGDTMRVDVTLNLVK